VLYRYETGSLTLREGQRLSVFRNRVLEKILGPKSKDVKGAGENCTRSAMICTFH
jgi:hypothetical protein